MIFHGPNPVSGESPNLQTKSTLSGADHNILLHPHKHKQLLSLLLGCALLMFLSAELLQCGHVSTSGVVPMRPFYFLTLQGYFLTFYYDFILALLLLVSHYRL